MTLVLVSSQNVQGIMVRCMCGAVVVLRVGERRQCACGKEYYCDFSLRIWENVVRVV